VKLILCVEDEARVLENNRKALIDGGYEVLTAENLAGAREHLSKQTPDAVVLDIMLPDGLGLDLLAELRERGCKTPVLLLTAWDKPYDVARGLRLGANDYLSKPFEYEVLLARIEAMFRNVEQLPERLEYGRLTFDIHSGVAFMDGVDMLLTQKEFSLLLLLIQHEARLMSAEFLYEKVWGQPMGVDDNAVRATVSRLRKKLTGSVYSIATDQGEGYCFKK
jgi:DNA-binding response OmpR family regulator